MDVGTGLMEGQGKACPGPELDVSVDISIILVTLIS
jgi:hypothetical protein